MIRSCKLSLKFLTADKRRLFVARTAANDWDAVILTQGAFAKIPLRTETQQTYIRAQVAEVSAAVRHMLSSGRLPPPLQGDEAARRCKGCSLIERCQPQATPEHLRAARRALFEADA